MRKNNWLLAAGILLLSCVSGLFFYGNRSQGKYVLVQVDGEMYGHYDLSIDQTIEIRGTNQLVIEGGKASMVSADCPDQICVNTAPIRNVHELIVCMPNRVTAEVCEE